MFSRIFNFKSEYKKNIFTLMTGTGVAQLIPVAIAPILTRLYSPEDFGLIALYLSIVSIITVFATGRYELAIMLPKFKAEVRAVVRLSAALISVVSVLALLFVFLFNHEFSDLLGNDQISAWLYILPASIFLTGFYQLINYLLIRDKKFNTLAMNKVVVSSTNAGSQLGVGYLFQNSFGLLLGNLIGQIASLCIIFKTTNISDYFKSSKYPIRLVAFKYRKFPQYDIPSVLMNVLANQMPLLILGKFFGLGVLGLYSFMYKILMMPINLLSNTVLDVFKQKASEDYNQTGNCERIFNKTFLQLLILGGVPFLILGMYAPELFSWIFGIRWQEAGHFAQIMTPMLFLKFIVNPLSYTFYIAQKQNIDLIFQITLFVLTACSLTIGVIFNNVKLALICFSATSSLIYFIYLGLSYRYSKGGVTSAT
jgi:O-antigen/teichoic acid export membrane protein